MLDNGRLQCDMARDCAQPVTHIGEDGYVYCAEDATLRRETSERTRKMRPWEIEQLLTGKSLVSYAPISKAEAAREAIRLRARWVDAYLNGGDAWPDPFDTSDLAAATNEPELLARTGKDDPEYHTVWLVLGNRHIATITKGRFIMPPARYQVWNHLPGKVLEAFPTIDAAINYALNLITTLPKQNALHKARNLFIKEQCAALDRLALESRLSGEHFDDQLCGLQRSARTQGFEAIEIIRQGGSWHGRYVGTDSYALHGTWFLFKNEPNRQMALDRAAAWYNEKPDFRTIYLLETEMTKSQTQDALARAIAYLGNGRYAYRNKEINAYVIAEWDDAACGFWETCVIRAPWWSPEQQFAWRDDESGKITPEPANANLETLDHIAQRVTVDLTTGEEIPA
jgi:hypothetical protein